MSDKQETVPLRDYFAATCSEAELSRRYGRWLDTRYNASLDRHEVYVMLRWEYAAEMLAERGKAGQ